MFSRTQNADTLQVARKLQAFALYESSPTRAFTAIYCVRKENSSRRALNMCILSRLFHKTHIAKSFRVYIYCVSNYICTPKLTRNTNKTEATRMPGFYELWTKCSELIKYARCIFGVKFKRTSATKDTIFQHILRWEIQIIYIYIRKIWLTFILCSE